MPHATAWSNRSSMGSWPISVVVAIVVTPPIRQSRVSRTKSSTMASSPKRSEIPKCTCGSNVPGKRIMPSTSISRLARPSDEPLPTPTICSPSIAIPPRMTPLGVTTRPFFRTMSCATAISFTPTRSSRTVLSEAVGRDYSAKYAVMSISRRLSLGMTVKRIPRPLRPRATSSGTKLNGPDPELVEGSGAGCEGRGSIGVRFDVWTPFDRLRVRARHSAGATNFGIGRFPGLRCLESVERSKGGCPGAGQAGAVPGNADLRPAS